jgi:uncharacterized membrane protein
MPFTPIILAHIAAAIGAVVLGGIMLALKRGTPIHRRAGRVWVALMLITALVSFGIKSSGNFSWIHLLSVGILVTLGGAIYAILHRNISKHQRMMISAYIGLIAAGAAALLPHRRLGYLVWSAVGLA